MDPTRDAFAELTLEEKALVNGVCQQFETALRDGAVPSIAPYVADRRGAVREILLGELLILACEFELQRKGTIDLDRLIQDVPEARSLAGAAVKQAQRYAGLSVEQIAARQAGANPIGQEGLLPESLGRFRLKSVLGSGTFGTVFLAEDPERGCDVALKVPHLTTLFSPELKRRFLREGEAASALDHPGLVKVLEVGETGLVCYIASEYVEGTTLGEWLLERKKNGEGVSPELAVRITLTLASAIQHAHERGVLHCDLKPANVLIAPIADCGLRIADWQRSGNPQSAIRNPQSKDSATLKITDFGLARLIADQSKLSQTGQILGTPSYMAPEQARGNRSQITARTDVYGLGAVLYELLTNRPPFDGFSLVDIFTRVLSEEPARPRSLVSSLPGDLEAVCLQCLEKDPQRRYASAASLADDLKRWLGNEPVRARTMGLVGRVWRWSCRKPVVASLVALLAFAVVAGSSTSLVLGYRAARNETRALAGEAEALGNLLKEESARQDAEEHYVALRQLLSSSIRVQTSGFMQSYDQTALPDSMLDDAEVSLARVIQRRPDDLVLRGLFADVLRRQGYRQELPQSLIRFEKAARQWEMIPVTELREQKYLASRAATYACLGECFHKQGDFARSIAAFEICLPLWDELAAAGSNPHVRGELLIAAGGLGRSMIVRGSSEKEVIQRFDRYRRRPELLGGKQGYQVLLGLLRIHRLVNEASRQHEFQQGRAALAAVREAAAVFASTFFQPELESTHRVVLVGPFFDLCTSLRQRGAPEEALVLAEGVLRSLQDLARRAPENNFLISQLSNTWIQVGKARWNLGQAERTIDAYRQALVEQRRACILAPSVSEYRKVLGMRCMQLGRKLCELGRLDEAETCFHERQALWPGDKTRHAEVLRELRKWADQVSAGKSELSPQARLERQRYLDLCKRLERSGSRAPARAEKTSR
jgi:tetratricopeptide (TPR) repeat protein